MATVLGYTNKSGFRNEQVWKPENEKQFSSQVKYYVQDTDKKIFKRLKNLLPGQHLLKSATGWRES